MASGEEGGFLGWRRSWRRCWVAAGSEERHFPFFLS